MLTQPVIFIAVQDIYMAAWLSYLLSLVLTLMLQPAFSYSYQRSLCSVAATTPKNIWRGYVQRIGYILKVMTLVYSSYCCVSFELDTVFSNRSV